MKKIVLLLGLALFIAGFVFASGGDERENDDSTYVFAVDSTWPPMEFIDIETNTIVGFTIDLVNAIAEEEGFTPEFVTVTWDGIFAGLEVGDYDAIASSVTITDERKAKMLFSDSYFNAGQLLAVRKEDANKINGLEDLSGKEVAVQIGTSGAILVEETNPDIILKTYQDLGPAVEEMANGTIDGLVADTPLVAHYLFNSERYKGRFVSVGAPMTSENYGFVFPLDDEGEELKSKVDSGLAKVRASGKFDEIYKKWIEK